MTPSWLTKKFFAFGNEPKALEAILEEILQEAGQDLCSVRLVIICNFIILSIPLIKFFI